MRSGPRVRAAISLVQSLRGQVASKADLKMKLYLVVFALRGCNAAVRER